jgi:molybdate transport system substrate-binding protein
MTNQDQAAGAAAIKVLCSNSLHAVLKELVPDFERASGHKVAISYETAIQAMSSIRNGAAADAIILNAPSIDELTKLGKIAPGSSRTLARCGIGIAVRAGAPKPHIGSVEAFKRALLDAKSIAHTEVGASGIHFMKLIERLGIAAQVKAKTHTRPGGLIGELVANGEAELAVQQIPELMAVAGIDVVGPLPNELQATTTVTAAVFSDAGQPDAAHAFLAFLLTPAAAGVFKAKGFDPG